MVDLPKLSKRFRPKLESRLLTELNDAAWQSWHDSTFTESRTREVEEILVRHLRALYPAEDMALLAKYGLTRILKDRIWVNLPGASGTEIPLHTEIVVPENFVGVPACSTRFSQDPDRGIKGGRAGYELRKDLYGHNLAWEEFCAEQDETERHYAPVETEPFFQDVIRGHEMYKAQYKAIRGWPFEYKKEHGQYPTWREILDAFPVVAGFVADNCSQDEAGSQIQRSKAVEPTEFVLAE